MNDNASSTGAHLAAAPAARRNDAKQGGDLTMYQPALRPDQIAALYQLKVALRRPMTKLIREAVDRYLQEMQRKAEEAGQYGTTLLDWLTYAQEREAEAGAAAKQTADLADVNTPC